MADTKSGQEQQSKPVQTPEPRGFGEHTRKTPSENAHELGWGLNQDERTRLPEGKQPSDGGTDYDYGARDFGDSPTDGRNEQAGLDVQPVERDSRKRGAA
jgi:hypothetical protein